MLSPNLLSTKPYAASSKAQPEHGPSQKSRADYGATDRNRSWDLKGLRNPVPVLKFWMGPSITTVFGPCSRTEPQSLRTDNPQYLWNHVTLSFTKSFWLKLRWLSFPGWPSGPSDLQARDFWRFFWRLDKVSQKSGSQKVRLWKSFKQRS